MKRTEIQSKRNKTQQTKATATCSTIYRVGPSRSQRPRYQGKRKGLVFQTGGRGVGYYADKPAFILNRPLGTAFEQNSSDPTYATAAQNLARTLGVTVDSTDIVVLLDLKSNFKMGQGRRERSDAFFKGLPVAVCGVVIWLPGMKREIYLDFLSDYAEHTAYVLWLSVQNNQNKQTKDKQTKPSQQIKQALCGSVHPRAAMCAV